METLENNYFLNIDYFIFVSFWLGDQPNLIDPFERKNIYIADGVMQVNIMFLGKYIKRKILISNIDHIGAYLLNNLPWHLLKCAIFSLNF